MSLSSLKINETPPSPSSTSEGGGEKREREDSPTRSQGQGQGHGPTTSSMSIPSIEIQGSTPPKNGQSNDNAPIQPKLKAILPSLTSCVHTSCYWSVQFSSQQFSQQKKNSSFMDGYDDSLKRG